MKIVVFLVAICAIAIADYSPPVEDEDYLVKQKFLLDVLSHIHQPLQHQKYLKDAGNYVEGPAYYKNYEPVKKFFTEINLHGTIPKNYLVTVFNPKHLKECKGLFNVFYYSKDWQTFYKNVLWARQNLNEGIFVYALTLAVTHRPDFEGFTLPAPYEICPYMFYTTDVLAKVKNFNLNSYSVQNAMQGFTVLANYTDSFPSMNKELELAYFTEDIGWNSYNYYFHIDYPFWMGGKEFNLYNNRRGELYLFVHQQILARYFMERLSQNLGNIPLFSWTQPIKTGYNPHMQYYNGLSFSVRKNYYDVMLSSNYDLLDTVQDYERRIRDMIDMGLYLLPTGEKIDLRVPENVEFLGNMIQGNPDSVDANFLDYMTILASTLLRGDTSDDFPSVSSIKYNPSVLEHFQAAMRDPIYYQLYNRVMLHYSTFKDYLQPYTYNDLLLPGVSIQNISTTRLVTYFDYFDAEITNAADVPVTYSSVNIGDVNQYQTEVSQPFVINVRQKRLNHRPFTVTFDVLSDQPRQVVVRLYMAPTLDRHRLPITLSENRDNFVQLDQFVYDLPAGKATINRNSKEFYWSVNDPKKYSELYQQTYFDRSEAHCSFPDRLVLPKGWVAGFPMKLFVIITPYNNEKGNQQYLKSKISCGIKSGSRFIDNLPLGYPFDRAVDETAFTTPNMFLKDVAVYFMPEGMMANVADLNPKWAWIVENIIPNIAKNIMPNITKPSYSDFILSRMG